MGVSIYQTGIGSPKWKAAKHSASIFEILEVFDCLPQKKLEKKGENGDFDR